MAGREDNDADRGNQPTGSHHFDAHNAQSQRQSRLSAPGTPRNWSMPIRDESRSSFHSTATHHSNQQQPPMPTMQSSYFEGDAQRRSPAHSQQRRSDEYARGQSTRGIGMAQTTDTRSHDGSSRGFAGDGFQDTHRRTDYSYATQSQHAQQSAVRSNNSSRTDNYSFDKQTTKTVGTTVAPLLDHQYSHSPPPYSRPRTSAKRKRGAATPSKTMSWLSRVVPVAKIGSGLERATKFVLRIHDMPPTKDGRRIPLDPSRNASLVDERTNRAYIGNTIRSSKYNAWNFLPRQLFAQFSKLANFYFLVVSILQLIPGLSTTGTYTTIAPLMFFISVSMGKEGYEDLRRHRLDKEENNRRAKVLNAFRPMPASKRASKKGLADEEASQHWTALKWHRLQVGDIVKLNRDDAAPADLILLHSAGPNGIAYVETMALDGETNLKPKQSPASTRADCQTAAALAKCQAEFIVEDPNLDLYNFEGRVTINGKTSPLTNNEIIYRGSILRNTPEAYGLVIYTGEECKIRMNANKNPRVKAPSLQYIVNKIVFFIVIFVVLLSVFCTVGYRIWRESVEVKAWYITRGGDVPTGQIIAGFIIMYNTMIPLSLYVSMEIIKICQMLLLNDVDMYDEVTNTPFEAHTSTINEELGQVSYIFSDKTGTLTENIMRFRKLSVAGCAWLHDADLKGLPNGYNKNAPANQKGKTDAFSPLMSNDSTGARNEFEMKALQQSQWQSSARTAQQQGEPTTSDMIAYVQENPDTAFSRKAKMLILSLAICHTCLPERSGHGDEVSYQASSPDELALVQAAVDLGYLAWDREVAILTLKVYPQGLNGEPHYETYEVLDIIEFSSKRKRMSVIVKFPDGRLCVMCKGADSVIMERLRSSELAKESLGKVERRNSQRRGMETHEALRRQSSQVERRSSVMSTAGSLHMAAGQQSTNRLAPIRDEIGGWLDERERVDDFTYNRVTESPAQARRSFQAHRAGVHDGSAFIDEEVATDETAIMERCFEHINDFASEGLRTLLYGHRFLQQDEYLSWKKIYHDATTSLVNRQVLVEKAGELIEQQLDLTGATAIEDKLQKGVPETIERLRRANIKLWMLTGDKRETAINIGHSCRLIKDYSAVTVLDMEDANLGDIIERATFDIDQGRVAHSVVVVDGATLSAIEADHGLYDLFIDLAILADSVICCRASPSQKAGLVEGIRREVIGSVTLAIGDGANDIAMIQEAHVGIGITGKEGLQAARTSDYAIAQFRFLTKLLLVHGRWNYIRTCKYTVGTFWKEIVFYLVQALYQLWNGYTGTSLYEPWSLTMFNTLFTSLPVIFLGIFEKDLQAATLIAVPELYTRGQQCLGFNFKVYLSWMFLGSAEAMLIYFITYTLYAGFSFSTDQSLFAIGDLCFTAAVIVISIKLQVLEIHDHSIMAAIAIVLSVGGWFLWNLLLSLLYRQNQIYAVQDGFLRRFGQNVAWWLVVILSVAACVVLEYGVRAVKAAYKPTDVESFQALQKDPVMRQRFESASALWLKPGWSDAKDKASKKAFRHTSESSQPDEEQLDQPRAMEAGDAYSMPQHPGNQKRSIEREVQDVMVADGFRQNTKIHDMLKRHSANIRH